MTKMLNTEPTKISLEVPKIILQQTHFSIILLDTDHSSTQEEVVLVHVDFAGCLQDLGAHLEGEEQLVSLKQTATGVPIFITQLSQFNVQCFFEILIHYEAINRKIYLKFCCNNKRTKKYLSLFKTNSKIWHHH